MHMLSARNRSEFLAVPTLVRFTMANGKDGPEATLLIKCSTLALKYLVQLKYFRLKLARVSTNTLVYGVEVDDDTEHPATFWSVLELQDELDALSTLTKSSKCVVFLFNELAVNVAWGDCHLDLSNNVSLKLVEATATHPKPNAVINGRASERLDALYRGALDPTEGVVLAPVEVAAWHPITSHYITNRATASLLHIIDGEEGAQQEELALWLVDSLQPPGAVRSPQIHEASGVRELSDLLITYEHGSFLIESKTLSVFSRDVLPSRRKLASGIRKHIQKATRQLIGGVKNLKRGLKVTDLSAVEIDVERRKVPHVIVLVPDLSLLSDATEFGGEFIRHSMKEAGAFFHILDPVELLRYVQAAEMIAERSIGITRMMAFDSRLLERVDAALAAETPDFGVLIRFSEDFAGVGISDE